MTLKALLAAGSQRTWLDEVQADSPVALWLMQEASGTTLSATTGSSGTISGSGMTYHAAGPGKLALPYALQFSGTGSHAYAAHNFGTARKLSVCFWLWWDSYTNNDNMAMEYTNNSNAASAFVIDPNESSSGKFRAWHTSSTGSGYRGTGITRPSAAAWHHYAFTFDRDDASSALLYVDGAVQSGTAFTSGTWTPTDLANSTLYFMSRGASSLRGAGRMCGVSLHTSILSATRIAAHYAGA